MIGWIFILGCVIAIVLYWRAGAARVSVVEDDTCAQCGYIVHGLPRPVCPECGADLSSPGAVRRRGSPAGARSPWWGLLGPPVIAVVYLVVAAFVLEQAPRIHQETTTRVWADPYSQAFRSVTIDYTGDVYKRAALPGGVGRITLALNDGTTAVLEVEPTTGRYRSTGGPATVSGSEFSPDAFVRWAQACGLDTTSASVGEEMAAIETALRQISAPSSSMKAGRPFRSASYRSSSQPDRRTYIVLSSHVLLAVAWVAGTAWLVRRARVARLPCRPGTGTASGV